jgi:hypothetical protein
MPAGGSQEAAQGRAETGAHTLVRSPQLTSRVSGPAASGSEPCTCRINLCHLLSSFELFLNHIIVCACHCCFRCMPLHSGKRQNFCLGSGMDGSAVPLCLDGPLGKRRTHSTAEGEESGRTESALHAAARSRQLLFAPCKASMCRQPRLARGVCVASPSLTVSACDARWMGGWWMDGWMDASLIRSASPDAT